MYYNITYCKKCTLYMQRNKLLNLVKSIEMRLYLQFYLISLRAYASIQNKIASLHEKNRREEK